ncbi:hypothetical protein L6452_33942 [Arctium lappa]|uniref:Uncharacterized protein n=1 Tax=Arctium lappa TaxID=4217 RepID=A0ACB8YHG7_ARCLA|nr:hypothetical protein L6452_33942 [Arctium lappa]
MFLPWCSLEVLDDARLHDNGGAAIRRRGVRCGDRQVVFQAVVSTNDTECRRQPRHNLDLPNGTDVDAVTEDELTTLEKVFVGLWVLEASDDGPDCVHGGGDGLDYGGGTLVVSDHVGMVVVEVFWESILGSGGEIDGGGVR